MEKDKSKESNPIEYIPLKSDDVENFEIFIVKSLCWKCKSEIELITYHSQVNGFDNYLGSFPYLDELLLKKYPQFLVKRISKTQGVEVISNLCRKCDQIQGNFYQWELWKDIKLEDTKPKYLEAISTKVSDIMTQEELDDFNANEREIFEEDRS